MNTHDAVTDEELASVAKLDRLATPGPFRVNRYDCDWGAINWQVQQDDNASGDEVIANITDDEPKRAKHDAAFIVLARTLLPRLAVAHRATVAALREARADRDALATKTEKLIAQTDTLAGLVETMIAEADAHREGVKGGLATTAALASERLWDAADDARKALKRIRK